MRRLLAGLVLLFGAGTLPAAAEPVCAPAPTAPFGGTCSGVRPGTAVSTVYGDCTLGFLFTGSDRRRYAATAGHCGAVDGIEMSWGPKDRGPVVFFGDQFIGRFAYVIHKGDVDFALVRLERNVVSDPQICHFGGPTGINAEVSEDPAEVRYVGQGFGNDVSPARTGVAPFGHYKPDYTYVWGATFFGDSGGPVIDPRGRAIGVVTQLKASGLGDIGINRLSHHLTRARQRLKIKLTLLTARTR